MFITCLHALVLIHDLDYDLRNRHDCDFSGKDDLFSLSLLTVLLVPGTPETI